MNVEIEARRAERPDLCDVLEAEAPGQFERVVSEVEAAVAGSLRKLGGLGVEHAVGSSREDLALDAVSIVAAATFSACADFIGDEAAVASAFGRGLAEVSV